MNPKPTKVEEPAGTYAAKPAKRAASRPAPTEHPASTIRFAKLDEVKKTNERLMQIHQEVLRKLAQ